MGAATTDNRTAKRELLHAIPVVRPGVQILDAPGDTVAVALTVERGKGFFDMFRPLRTNRRFELDRFGTFVVRQMNGGRTVMQIIDAFHESFGMSRRECELGVVAFLKMLMQRQAVSVVTVSES